MPTLDHKTDTGKEKNAVIVWTWIQKGTKTSGKDIEKVLKANNNAVWQYCRGN